MGLFDANGFVYNEGVVNTAVDCTNCRKQFVAKLNFDLTGNHVIVCPYCGHQHCRVITKGVVSGDRWDTRYDAVPCTTERCWSCTSAPIETTTAAEHIRRKWGLA